MRTLEAASRSRINVIQLTVTRETASWLAEQGQRGTNQTSRASRGGKEIHPLVMPLLAFVGAPQHHQNEENVSGACLVL